MTFNKMTREATASMKKDRLTPLLNGFDYKSHAQDGLAHFTYTGRGWLCWRDGVILGTGWADINPRWFESLCSFINGKPDGAFVFIGHGSPVFGSRKFYKWLETEGKERGYSASESQIDMTELIREL